MKPCSARIETLRQHALNCRFSRTEWQYLHAKGFYESAKQGAGLAYRYAAASKYMFENVLPAIDDGELIVGKMCGRELTPEENAQWELIKKYSIPSRPSVHGQASHMAVDYDLLLEKGAEGLIAEINGLKAVLDPAFPRDLEKQAFYDSCVAALEGLCVLADRYSSYAAGLAAACSDSGRKKELETIAGICARVPRKPASSFYEALQSASFLTFCLSGPDVMLYQLGRPDRYLLKFYEQDMANHAITEDFAQELIDCFGLLYNEYIPSGLACGFMVGGRDASGNDVTNPLTYLFIKSIEHIRMIYPGVGLCWNSDTPADLLELACETLGKGHSHPALFNDDIIIKGLERYGLPYEEACLYIHSTCVEITPCASSACWVASPYTNLVQILLDTLGVREEGGEANRFGTFAELKDAFFGRLSVKIKENLITENKDQMERTKHFYNPLLSCFVNDCLKTGKDIESGGARYNWIMPSFVGVANVADSFGVIEELIFNRKELTFDDLAEALIHNFDGFEGLRSRLNNTVEKYGNDSDRADAYVGEITRWISAECEKYTTCRGGRLVPSLFCWIMHNEFGKNTMASPDGRSAGFPLGDGSGPAQGREKNGPTASVLSSTKWDHAPFIGGVAVNMKFSKKLFGPQSIPKLTALVKTFMKRGGFELQINTVDKQTLLEAVERPELYGGLVVRVGGYSDFFVRLSPSMQAEVIERTEHAL